jgi:hypothetical protein
MEQNTSPIPHASPSHLGVRSAAVLVAWLALTTLAVWTAGCRLHVDKGANGEDKNVQIDTPFGGIHVKTDQITAADLGLPVYPGAHLEENHDQNKSADVHLGFGEWQLRVRAVTYGTPDTQDQVLAFYKKALARYGDVITCRDNEPVGTPTMTSEGLTCNDRTNVHASAGDYQTGEGGLELKAGSEHHQHIVGFESPESGRTRFALVALDLPTDVMNKSD